MLPSRFRLKRKQDFKRAFRVGKKIRGKYGMLVVVDDNRISDPLFGAVITKKIGNAVVRNKLKRRLMAIFAEFLKTGVEISEKYFVYVAFEFTDEFSKLETELTSQLKKSLS